jgi:hypothetical protein
MHEKKQLFDTKVDQKLLEIRWLGLPVRSFIQQHAFTWDGLYLKPKKTNFLSPSPLSL